MLHRLRYPDRIRTLRIIAVIAVAVAAAALLWRRAAPPPDATAAAPPAPPPAPADEPPRIIARWDRPPSPAPAPSRPPLAREAEVWIIGEPPGIEERLASQSRQEALGHLGGIRVALLAYEAAFGAIPVPAGPCPAREPGLGALRWEGECTAFFEELGWSPGADATRCSYEVEEIAADSGDPPDFVVTALCDGDGDSAFAAYEIRRESAEAAVLTEPSVY